MEYIRKYGTHGKYGKYEHMSSVSKYLYIDKFDNIVNEHKNTYHSAIKVKPVDVKSNTYVDSSKEVDNKVPKLILYGFVTIQKFFFFFFCKRLR